MELLESDCEAEEEDDEDEHDDDEGEEEEEKEEEEVAVVLEAGVELGAFRARQTRLCFCASR
jgi:hypothetical protein